MLVMSLRSTLAAHAWPDGERRASGNVGDWKSFFRPEVLTRFDEAFAGVYAFLAFHPKSDSSFVEYVKKGSVGTDGGGSVMVLFTLDGDAQWLAPRPAKIDIPGVNSDTGNHPAFELVRQSIAQRPLPPFPGIVFFDRVSSPVEPVFVSVAQAKTPDDVEACCRALFAMAEAARSRATKEAPFAGHLALALAKAGAFPYCRGGSTSMGERFYQAVHFALLHKQDIVSVIGVAQKLATGGAG